MKMLFIHHSTGTNLINDGNLRTEIRKLNPTIEFWDHSYNLFSFLSKFLARFTHHKGLSDSNGEYTGRDYNIVLSNNSPREYAEIFGQDKNDLTLSAILSYDVVAFKSCYPTTKIESDDRLSEDIRLYDSIANNLKKYSENKFIILTPPQERRECTTFENAKRAKRLVNHMTSKEFLKGTTNISVFDFFSLLSDSDGFLKKEYCRLIPLDSHPNKKANETIAPIFAKFINDTVSNPN